jgi:hypothetical protein
MRLPLGRLFPSTNRHNRYHARPQEDQRRRLGKCGGRLAHPACLRTPKRPLRIGLLWTDRLTRGSRRSARGGFRSDETHQDRQKCPKCRDNQERYVWHAPRHGSPPPYASAPQARQRGQRICCNPTPSTNHPSIPQLSTEVKSTGAYFWGVTADSGRQFFS